MIDFPIFDKFKFLSWLDYPSKFNNKALLMSTSNPKKQVTIEDSVKEKEIVKEIEFNNKNYLSFQIALISIMVAIGVGGSYLLIGIPNVEILTFIVFLSGFLYGCKVGTIVGAISEAIFGGFNPNGVAILPFYVILIAAFALIGLFGGLIGNKSQDLQMSGWNVYKFAIIGAVMTLFFDIFTVLGWVWVTPGAGFYITLILQVPFTIIHVVANTLLFGLVAVPVVIRVRDFENR